jgi:outer membrane immunogenic protein
MTRKILLVAASWAVVIAALLLSAPSRAADKAEPPVTTAPAADKLPFHGLYIGGLIGHATGQTRDAEGFTFPREGYTVTGLIGYNHRLPGVVVGLEADLGATDVAGSTSAGGFTVTGSSKVLGSIRGRIGRAFGESLLYATGGLAMTNAKLAVETFGANEHNRVNGYVFGAGFETFAFHNVGVRLEALQYRWQDQGFVIGGADTGKLRSHDTHVRVGLIIRLN